MPHKNPTEHRDYQREYQRKRGREFRRKAIDLLGGKCSRCNFSDPRALQIDHVNADGHKDRRDGYNMEREYRNLCESIANRENRFQLLCANCNWIKYFESDRQVQKLRNEKRFGQTELALFKEIKTA